MKISLKNVVGTLAIATIAVSLFGCSSPTVTHSDGSRVKLYSSLAELAKDSSAVVAVTVASQIERPGSDSQPPMTTSTVSIDMVRAPATLGAALTKLVPPQLTSGGNIRVLQIGTKDSPGPAPLVAVGGNYLLYLTPTMLAGAAAD